MNSAVVLTKARAQLLLSHPFYATLLLRLRLQESTDVSIMGTDGICLYFNPEAVAALSLDHIKGVLVHEVLHVALQHHTRRGDRDSNAWNVAGDLVVNPIVKAAGLSLPDGHLYDPACVGKHVEEVYRNPHAGQRGGGSPPSRPPGGQKQQPSGKGQSGQTQQPNGNGQGASGGSPASFGWVKDAPAGAKDSQDTEWKMAVHQALQAARACGNVPAGIDQLIDAITGSSATWFERLKRFVASTVVYDSTWARPSRRTASLGIYLPSPIKDGVGHIDVAIDCSGSITNSELTEFGSKLLALHQELKPELVRAIYFDAVVQRVMEFGPYDQPTFQAKGRGGTDVRTVFEWIYRSGRPPKCLVVLTDLETPFPEPPNFPVLWVTVQKKTAPFGEVAFMEVG